MKVKKATKRGAKVRNAGSKTLPPNSGEVVINIGELLQPKVCAKLRALCRQRGLDYPQGVALLIEEKINSVCKR